MNYTLIRSKRKTVSLSVKNGEVIVRAPKTMKKPLIDEFVLKHEKWIQKRILEYDLNKSCSEKALSDDEINKLKSDANFYLKARADYYCQMIGVKYNLSVMSPASKAAGSISLFSGGIKSPTEFRRSKAPNAWLQSSQHFLQTSLQKMLCSDFNKITVRCQKTRWGSCSSNGNLSFNCLLMLMPSDVIDSVVCHELCHLKYMNHQKEFYFLLKSVFPRYDECKKWLKENGQKILLRVKTS